MTLIRTKIARVMSDTTVVLAAGSGDLVKEGMEFVIYELGEKILDPDTGEPLGQIEYVKGRVVVKHVMERMSMARTRTRTVTRQPFGLSVWKQYSEEVHDRLNVETTSPDYEKASVVRVGDLARSVDV